MWRPRRDLQLFHKSYKHTSKGFPRGAALPAHGGREHQAVPVGTLPRPQPSASVFPENAQRQKTQTQRESKLQAGSFPLQKVGLCDNKAHSTS